MSKKSMPKCMCMSVEGNWDKYLNLYIINKMLFFSMNNVLSFARACFVIEIVL